MMKQVAGSLKLDLAQFRELEAFTQFGSDLDEATQKQLNRGQRMVELLKQDQYVPVPVAKQVIIIWAGTKGHLDDIPVASIRRFEREFLAFCEKSYPDIEHTLAKELKISDDISKKLENAVREFKSQFNKEEAVAAA
jgi:F-type H+-transporting ATPase subunit alpha